MRTWTRLQGSEAPFRQGPLRLCTSGGDRILQLKDRISKQAVAAQAAYALSARETEVVNLLARGRTVPVIAEELFISENTVRTHCKHIYTKLGVHSKQELAQLLESTMQ